MIRSTITKWLDVGDVLTLLKSVSFLSPLLVGIGFAAIAYWIYAYVLDDQTVRVRRIIAILGILGIPASALLTHFAIPATDDRSLILDQAGTFQKTILAQQVHSGADAGGFRFAIQGVSDEAQAWTTAQCLVALLGVPETVKSSPENIRAGFDYLERVRRPGLGWGYMIDEPVGVTEIDAWVLVAESRSLQPVGGTDIWPTNQHAAVKERILSDVADLAARQHGDGGWGPLPRSDRPDYERSYSTVMALWALVEARDTQLVSSSSDWHYDDNIRRASNWLLNHRVRDADGNPGWSTNPVITRPARIMQGLTAHALYALARAARDFPYISAQPEYREARSDFLRLSTGGTKSYEPISARAVSENDQGHDSDRYFTDLGRVFPQWAQFRAESSTFLWYPWTLAAALMTQADGSASDSERKMASRIVKQLSERSGDVAEFAGSDNSIYPTAEISIAYSLYRETAK